MSVTVSNRLLGVKALPEGRPTDYTVRILAFDDSPAAFCVALVLTVSAATLSIVDGKAYALHSSYVALDVSLSIRRPDKHLLVVNMALHGCSRVIYLRDWQYVVPLDARLPGHRCNAHLSTPG